MQTLTRTYTVCEFSELAENIRERLIEDAISREQDRGIDYYSHWDSFRDDVSEYWMPERLAPAGFIVDEIPWRNGFPPYASGGHPAMCSDSNGNVDFRASVDVETYIRHHKLGKHCRALLELAKRQPMQWDIGTDTDRRGSACRYSDSLEDAMASDGMSRAYSRDSGLWEWNTKHAALIDRQARLLASNMEDAYGQWCRKLSDAYQAEIENAWDREWIEEQLRDGINGFPALYFPDGRSADHIPDSFPDSEEDDEITLIA